MTGHGIHENNNNKKKTIIIIKLNQITYDGIRLICKNFGPNDIFTDRQMYKLIEFKLYKVAIIQIIR